MTDINALLRHELSLQRVTTGLINKGLFSSLDEAYAAVRSILLNAETITNERQLNSITRAITQAINESMSQGWATYSSELGEVAIFDASYYAQNIGVPVVPAANTIQSFIDSALMSLTEGGLPKVGTWAEFVQENTDGLAKQVNNLVKAGYSNNLTVGQIARSIKPYIGNKTPDGRFIPGKGGLRAEALARTGVQHYMQSARRAMAAANADIITKEYPLITFDNRTSDKCIGISEKYPNGWKYNESPVGYPPYHFRCRTSIIFGLKGQGDPRKGVDKPAIGSGDNYESGDKYKGRKSSRAGEFEVEQVPADMSFGTWLKSQDRDFVEDVLGKGKANAFLSGKISLERMSDSWGNPLTLEQLKQRYPDAFGG